MSDRDYERQRDNILMGIGAILSKSPVGYTPAQRLILSSNLGKWNPKDELDKKIALALKDFLTVPAVKKKETLRGLYINALVDMGLDQESVIASLDGSPQDTEAISAEELFQSVPTASNTYFQQLSAYLKIQEHKSENKEST